MQGAVDAARNAGADFVVLLAHLGQSGQSDVWRSDTLASRCRGIDVIVDGHSHEEYVQVVADADGRDVIITQTGTQFSSVGQIVISPEEGSISVSTPGCEARLLRETRRPEDPTYVDEASFGRDEHAQAAINQKVAEVRAQTGAVVGQSEVELRAYEDDGHTWAVRSRETNLGDLVADAYLYYASNNGVIADVALVNGGGVRSDLHAGDVTRADLINVNPFNNQLCYTRLLGQDLLDALEVSARSLPEPSGDFLQVSEGLELAIRTDIPSPVMLSGRAYAGIDGTAERRVRRATLYGKPIDPAATYTLVCHSYYLIDGGGLYAMLNKNPVTLLGLDNEALIEYVQVNLHGSIGPEYAESAVLGRIEMQEGPDPVEPEPEPQPESPSEPTPEPKPGSPSSPAGEKDADAPAASPSQAPIPATGDAPAAGTAAAAAIGVALLASSQAWGR